MPNPDDARPSTLNEINQQIAERCFELLSFISPRTWVDPRRIVYSPVDEFGTAIEIFEGTGSSQRPEHLQVPFAYFSRHTGLAVGDTYNFSRRPWAEWLSTYAHQIPRSDKMVKFIPAVFQYRLRIFDNRFQKLESLIDAHLHMGVRQKSRRFFYDSQVLGIRTPYSIDWGNPQYDQNPNLRQKLQERGRLYSIIIPFEVYCALGQSLPAKRIEQINVGLYSRRGRDKPTPNADDKIEGFMIDSNTEI